MLETEVTNANIVVLRRGVNLVVKTGPTGKLTEAFGIVLNPIHQVQIQRVWENVLCRGPKLQLSMIIIPCSAGFVIKSCFILCW